MKFKTRKAAETWRKLQPFPGGHESVKTTYFNMKMFRDCPCWTVIFTN